VASEPEGVADGSGQQRTGRLSLLVKRKYPVQRGVRGQRLHR
jgi:hypothetical protein